MKVEVDPSYTASPCLSSLRDVWQVNKSWMDGRRQGLSVFSFFPSYVVCQQLIRSSKDQYSDWDSFKILRAGVMTLDTEDALSTFISLPCLLPSFRGTQLGRLWGFGWPHKRSGKWHNRGYLLQVPFALLILRISLNTSAVRIFCRELMKNKAFPLHFTADTVQLL